MNDQVTAVPEAAKRGGRTGRLAAALMVLLVLCEVVILQRYLGAVEHNTRLQIELEFARGAATIAQAQAQRCVTSAETR